jgi:hypothetical protein
LAGDPNLKKIEDLIRLCDRSDVVWGIDREKQSRGEQVFVPPLLIIVLDYFGLSSPRN